MLLQDIPEDNNLVIELSMNGQKYEFPSKVIRKVNQSVLVEPIRINGKILSFNSSGGGITVSVYMIRDSKPPMLWKGVAVNSIREHFIRLQLMEKALKLTDEGLSGCL